MREYYFAHLQNVVSENCHICNSAPNINVLKNLSLELEQKALLASLQSDIYVEAITKIVSNTPINNDDYNNAYNKFFTILSIPILSLYT